MKKQLVLKWIFLGVLLLIPIYGLWLFKDIIFNGGDKSRLPTLKVVTKPNGAAAIIPEFSFVNQDNEIITNETYKGKIYIADFIFTTCPSICRDMTLHMEYLQGKLSKYDNILYLSHTINPEYDTPEILKEYAKRYEAELGADLSTWNFVTGDKYEIYEIARSYLCAAEESNKEEGHGGFIHSGAFVLIDTEGRIRCGYDSNGNPIGVYDGTSLSSVKDLIVDVGVLVSETKRKARENEK